jgi:hypothetical protein
MHHKATDNLWTFFEAYNMSREDGEDEVSKEQVRALVKSWLASSYIAEREYKPLNAFKTRKGLKPGLRIEAILPERED